MVNNIFFLDLDSLDKKVDDKLNAFAKKEDLNIEDVKKIIKNEAERIGEKNKVKVNFKMIDPKEDSFKVIVEPAYVKYKGTVIYPFDKIKSNDFEMELDAVCGKITLYNMKEKLKNISVTIEYVALDLFAMTYKKAKEFLINISDRKVENGYIEFKDSVCFKQYGVRINANVDENGNILEDNLIKSIDVYNKEEFFKEYKFKEEKKEEKYDVNIPFDEDVLKQNVEVENKDLNTDNNQEVEIVIDESTIEETKNEDSLPVEKQQDLLDKRIKEKLKELNNKREDNISEEKDR